MGESSIDSANSPFIASHPSINKQAGFPASPSMSSSVPWSHQPLAGARLQRMAPSPMKMIQPHSVKADTNSAVAAAQAAHQENAAAKIASYLGGFITASTDTDRFDAFGYFKATDQHLPGRISRDGYLKEADAPGPLPPSMMLQPGPSAQPSAPPAGAPPAPAAADPSQMAGGQALPPDPSQQPAAPGQPPAQPTMLPAGGPMAPPPPPPAPDNTQGLPAGLAASAASSACGAAVSASSPTSREMRRYAFMACIHKDY
jgi:hypothetical protein